MKQPKALYLLNFISMWECFSYYGMRGLLVLFMTHELGFADLQAFGLYALYITFVDLGGVIGGWLADRYLGLKRSIALGGWTILCGHATLAFSESVDFFYLGLGMIIAGCALFRSNVAALVGECYQENDLRREAGFTIYYTGINIGGFLAAIFCGVVAEWKGFHAGFGLAAFGMLAGNLALIFGRKILLEKAKEKAAIATIFACMGLLLAAILAAFSLRYHFIATWVVPVGVSFFIFHVLWQMKSWSANVRSKMPMFAVFILLLILYYGCEEQVGSSLVLFAERHVDRSTIFGTIPAASLVTMNPLTILVFGPLLSRLFMRLRFSDMAKIQASFVLLSLSFCLLYIGSSSEVMSLSFAVMNIVLVAIGELLIGPTIYAATSKCAPKERQGLMMGFVTLGFSLASLVSGALSQMIAANAYSNGFGVIAIGALVVAILCQFKKREIVYD